MKKIKASLALIVGNDANLIGKIKKLYIKSTSIYTEEKEEKDFVCSKNLFTNFIEEDTI
jgi:hypothetical protein